MLREAAGSKDERSSVPLTMNEKEVKTTRFVNIDTIKFTFFLGGQPIEVNPSEEKVLTVYAAEHGAKHLVDLILQRDYHISNTLADTELRRDVMARIIPDLAREAKVVPKSKEEFEELVRKELAEQKKQLLALAGAQEADSEKDKKIADLEKRLSELEKPKKEPKLKVAKK